MALLAVVVPLLALFVYVVLRSGPLAPVAVTLATVESKALTPALFGVGTVGTRTSTKIGPTVAGRLLRLDVDVGDRVRAGQVLGEMDKLDLDDRLSAQDAALQRVQASLREAQARQAHAQVQATRYSELLTVQATTQELAATKQQELQVANAAVAAAQAEAARVRAERAAIGTQQRHLRLVAPAAGLVTLRFADPGTTVVAGQAVVEVVDPASLWVNVRLDQINARGLKAGLPASVCPARERNNTRAGKSAAKPCALIWSRRTLIHRLAGSTTSTTVWPATTVLPGSAKRCVTSPSLGAIRRKWRCCAVTPARSARTRAASACAAATAALATCSSCCLVAASSWVVAWRVSSSL